MPKSLLAKWKLGPNFIDKDALQASRGKERSLITGIEVASAVAVEPGARVRVNGKDVGVAASSTYSRQLMKSLAMAQNPTEQTDVGTQVEIIDGKTYRGTVVSMPFYDPMRIRTYC
ncbi:MAG: hypothetical protein JSR78_17140 [Proteobacteria bacterium]|nr:hypothetical protein [Pseudomonadota bacterium]